MVKSKAGGSRAFATDVEALRAEAGRAYLEFLRARSMSAGLYVLPPGEVDRQQPHAQDEIYVVIEGECAFEVDGERLSVTPGAVLFVPAGVPHRFVDIRKELRTIVMFAPPET